MAFLALCHAGPFCTGGRSKVYGCLVIASPGVTMKFSAIKELNGTGTRMVDIPLIW